MRIMNPGYVKPQYMPAERAALVAFLGRAGNSAKESFSFDELRAAVPALASLTDGQIHQLAIDAGLVTVER